jgi:hypothetical protein
MGAPKIQGVAGGAAAEAAIDVSPAMDGELTRQGAGDGRWRRPAAPARGTEGTWPPELLATSLGGPPAHPVQQVEDPQLAAEPRVVDTRHGVPSRRNYFLVARSAR